MPTAGMHLSACPLGTLNVTVGSISVQNISAGSDGLELNTKSSFLLSKLFFKTLKEVSLGSYKKFPRAVLQGDSTS